MNFYLLMDSVVPTGLSPVELIKKIYFDEHPIPLTPLFIERFQVLFNHHNILFKHPDTELIYLTHIHSYRMPPGMQMPEGNTEELATLMAEHGGTILIYNIIKDEDSKSGFMISMRILSSAAIDPYIRPYIIDEFLADNA